MRYWVIRTPPTCFRESAEPLVTQEYCLLFLVRCVVDLFIWNVFNLKSLQNLDGSQVSFDTRPVQLVERVSVPALDVGQASLKREDPTFEGLK